PVYDSTPEASKISVKVHHVIFAMSADGIRAEELLVIRNAGDRTFVGWKDVAGGRRATLQFSLPAGAREVKYGQGLMECCIVPAEAGFVDTMDVKPGERQVVFSYALPPAGGQLQFIRPVDYPTEAIEVFVPEGAVRVSSEVLKLAGVVPGLDRRFQRYTGSNLVAPAAIALTLENLPAIGGGWRPYAYASVGIILLAGIAYPVVRRRRAIPSAAARPEASQPPSGVRLPARSAVQGPCTQTELAIRKVELVAALAELEAGRETGRIPEKDYRRLRQEKRKALRDVLAQLQAGPGAATTPSTA
ncbi:MAG TPA: hypothetical protein VLH58_02280, partial [Candidatus Methylomirabilis sp.]|nr:hypothetical protein [Candidatus Methylomirabilis sp.]